MLFKYSIWTLLLLCIWNMSWCNEDPIPLLSTQKIEINDQKYQDWKEKLNIEKKKKVLKLKESKSNKNSTKSTGKTNFSGISGFTNAILYIVIGFLVLVIIYLLLASIKLKRPESKASFKENLKIENLEEVNTFEGYDFFLRNKNYRQAFRMLFLRTLQELQNTKTIKWTPEKTNIDYQREMEKHEKAVSFRNLARVFDMIWYGDKEIGESQFRNSLSYFDDFLDDKSYNEYLQ